MALVGEDRPGVGAQRPELYEEGLGARQTHSAATAVACGLRILLYGNAETCLLHSGDWMYELEL